MSQKRWLDEKEKAKIDALVKSGLKVPHIAAIIERSPNCVRNYLKKKKGPTRRNKGGRAPKLSPRAKLVLENVAKKPGMTARRVMNESGVNVFFANSTESTR